MNDLYKPFEEGKLPDSACVLTSIYYEDAIFEYLDENDWVNYIIPVDESTKEFLRAYCLSDSEILKASVKKYAIHNGSLLNITDDGELIDFEHQWKVLSDFVLPSSTPFLASNSVVTEINVTTSLEDILIKLVENKDCTFVALVNTDSPCLAVFKSPSVTIGGLSNLVPDPVLRGFENYLPEEVGIILPGSEEDPDFAAVLCYAVPLNISTKEEEKIHGQFTSRAIPHAV